MSEKIEIAQKALRKDKLRGQNIPDIILQVLKDDNWRVRKFDYLGIVKEFKNFADFVQAPLPIGLDTDWEVVRKLIKGYPKVELAVAKVLTKKQGQRTDKIVTPEVQVNKTKKEKDLQQLERHRPDLLKKVFDGKLTVFGAMVEAGFRKRRLHISDNPKLVAKQIKKNCTKREIAELIKILVDELA